MKFVKFGGDIIENVNEYVQSAVLADPTLIISVGCDSKQLRHKTLYAVTIVFHSPLYKKGAHCIFKRFKVNKIKDNFNRLWKECEHVAETAEQLHEALNLIDYKRPESNFKLVDVHLDLNPKKKYLSNSVYDAAMPWLKGMGYNTIAKPNAFAASSASDLLVN